MKSFTLKPFYTKYRLEIEEEMAVKPSLIRYVHLDKTEIKKLIEVLKAQGKYD